MRLHSTVELDYAVADVFRFYADDHVKNHPRWDPDVQLTATSDDPLRVGSVIERHITRLGKETFGEMTVTRFDRDKAFSVEIHDGQATMIGNVTFEDLDGRTRLNVDVDAPDLPDELAGPVNALMQRSLENIKDLMAAES